MVDGKSDDDHDGSFDFTTTAAKTSEMTTVNDKYWGIFALPPSDYCEIRFNDAAFIFDPANTNEKLSWIKVSSPMKLSPLI